MKKNDDLKISIELNEGFKSTIYSDTRGVATVGYGFAVGYLTPDEIALNGGRVEPMEREAADAILNLKLEKLLKETEAAFPWLSEHPQSVQNTVMEMCYQMGVAKVKKFATTLHYIRNREYDRARENALKSTWARQTPNRAQKVLAGLII